MSCVCILTPVVIAAWPAFSAAVVAAAGSLGYQMASAATEKAVEKSDESVQLEIAGAEVVNEQLAREQKLAVTRDGVTITFSRDARGKASLCVTGDGHEESALRAMGEEMAGRVVQQYVYQKLLAEMQARQFLVVENEVDANQAIRLKVRHWA